MKCLQDMREEMNRRKKVAEQKHQVQAEKKAAQRSVVPPKPTIGRVLEKTPVVAAQEVRDGQPPLPVTPMNKAQTEALLKGGRSVLAEPIPEGYSAVSKNQKDIAEAYRDAMLAVLICSFDFETDADQDEGVDILRDKIVGVSFSYEAGKAIYIPIAHDSYAANWDVVDVIEMFRPVWESKEVMKIAWNLKFEFQILLRYGVRMPFENVADPMLMVLATGQFEDLALKKVTSEILPYLFDKYAEEVLPEVLSPEELDALLIEDGDESRWTWVEEFVNGRMAKKEVSVAALKEQKQKDAFWDAYVVPFKEITRVMVPDGTYKTGARKGETKWKKVQRSFNEMPVDKKTVAYGCKDSDWALQIFEKLAPILDKEGLLQVHLLLDAPSMMVLGEMELNGVPVLPAKLDDMLWEAEMHLSGMNREGNKVQRGIYDDLDEALFNLIKEQWPQAINEDGEIIVPAAEYRMGRWRKENVFLTIKSEKPFNWGSTQHLQWLFFSVLKLDPETLKIGRSSKTGLPSTGAEEIDKMIYANPNVPLFRILLKKREFEKIRDTYAKGILEFVQKDTERVHASLKLVRTWRLSCSKPNFQNLPRLDNDSIGIRKTVQAPKGKTIVSADQLEVAL